MSRVVILTNAPLLRTVRSAVITLGLLALRPWPEWHDAIWWYVYEICPSYLEVGLHMVQTVVFLALMVAAARRHLYRQRAIVAELVRMRAFEVALEGAGGGDGSGGEQEDGAGGGGGGGGSDDDSDVGSEDDSSDSDGLVVGRE